MKEHWMGALGRCLWRKRLTIGCDEAPSAPAPPNRQGRNTCGESVVSRRASEEERGRWTLIDLAVEMSACRACLRVLDVTDEDRNVSRWSMSVSPCRLSTGAAERKSREWLQPYRAFSCGARRGPGGRVWPGIWAVAWRHVCTSPAHPRSRNSYAYGCRVLVELSFDRSLGSIGIATPTDATRVEHPNVRLESQRSTSVQKSP